MHAGNQAAKCIGMHNIINGLCMDSDYLVVTENVTDILFYYLKNWP